MSVESLDRQSNSKRPKDSPFFQQKLPAWQPMFTAKKSAITFLILGICFIPLGGVFLATSNAVIEYVIDYTHCTDSKTGRPCADIIASQSRCTCVHSLSVKKNIPGPVYLYYGLENFYQNHRRYARSKSDAQLLGQKMSVSSLSECSPYDSYKNSTKTYAVLPCGAIANSIFNDTFSLTYQSSSTSEIIPVGMSNKGIAWKSDVERKFGVLTPEALMDTVKPPSWPLPEEQRSPGAFKSDEELMVWMRVAALPNFRKLYRRIVHQGQFKNGLPAGTYTFTIDYAFPVLGFKGKKSVVLGNASWLGGKNNTLGIMCLLTGFLHLLLGIAFLAVHIYSVRRSRPLIIRMPWQTRRTNQPTVHGLTK